MNREQVTDLIVTQKVPEETDPGPNWPKSSAHQGVEHRRPPRPDDPDRAQAKAVGAALDLPDEAVAQLQVVPYKGSLPTAVADRPADLPLLQS